uniref:Ig-like domain-containing protein n=1 Tax=Seriola lalandi dorsalis TaxID=1841481 RepID=A0A3B4Z0P7_SERLL
STCVLEEMEVLCRCSVDSNPKPAVTWSINGTVPPRDYNVSVTSEPHVLTATLRGRMDRPLTVICFAFNALGNDSLVLLQAGQAPLWWMVLPAVAICLVIFLLSLILYCCRKRAGKYVKQTTRFKCSLKFVTNVCCGVHTLIPLFPEMF